MSLLVTANVNTYQIKWYPDSLFNLFVVNLKTYFPHPPTPFATVLQTRYCRYCVHVLVYSLNTASVFYFFSDLPKEELPMTGRNGQKYQWQKSHNVLSLRPAKDKERHDQISETKRQKRLDEHNSASMTFWRLWRNNFCDVIANIISLSWL